MRFASVFVTMVFAPVLGFAQTDAGQNAGTEGTTTTLVARMGVRTDAPHDSTYHLVELLQSRGKWVVPDVGYIDFAHNNYREYFVGAGRKLYDGKKATLTGELYFSQAIGPAAHNACYLQPWTLLKIRPTPKITSETSYFAYLPLNQPARVQHVFERSKVEYILDKTWKAGIGYGGYKYAEHQWQNKPFVTATVSTGVGSLEVWLQKVPGGAQIQLRVLATHVARK